MKTAETKTVKYFINNYCEYKYSRYRKFGKSTIEHYFGTYISQGAFINAILELAVPLANRDFKVSIKKEFEHVDFMNKPLFTGHQIAEIRLQQLEQNLVISPAQQKQIELCIQWIQEVPTITKTIKRNCSSYFWKHEVERWAGTYISNDSFKLAARNAGLKIAFAYGENEYYNLTNK